MIDSICLNSASTIESEIFVVDNRDPFKTEETDSSLCNHVKKNLKINIEPSAEASSFKFSDLEQECADVHASSIRTVWTREAQWPI